jgi:hypothetical protein
MNSGSTSKGQSVQGAAPDGALSLSENLPNGEQLIWQGHPQRLALATRAMYLKYIAFYLVALIAARTGYLILDGEPVATWSGPGLASARQRLCDVADRWSRRGIQQDDALFPYQ